MSLIQRSVWTNCSWVENDISCHRDFANHSSFTIDDQKKRIQYIVIIAYNDTRQSLKYRMFRLMDLKKSTCLDFSKFDFSFPFVEFWNTYQTRWIGYPEAGDRRSIMRDVLSLSASCIHTSSLTLRRRDFDNRDNLSDWTRSSSRTKRWW